MVVRKRLKKEITPSREKISFKVISNHINKLLSSQTVLETYKIQNIKSEDKQGEQLTDEIELEARINKIKAMGEELFAEGAYLEAQKQFELARDILVNRGKKDEAKLLSELISGIDGLIEEREKRINILEQVKIEGDPVKLYEIIYEIIEISKKLRDPDTISMYKSELIQFFQINEFKLLDIENYRNNLEVKAESLFDSNEFELAAQLYEKCENYSQFLASLEKVGEIANIEKFRNKKAECLKRISKI
jgi:hypothetical protein